MFCRFSQPYFHPSLVIMIPLDLVQSYPNLRRPPARIVGVREDQSLPKVSRHQTKSVILVDERQFSNGKRRSPKRFLGFVSIILRCYVDKSFMILMELSGEIEPYTFIARPNIAGEREYQTIQSRSSEDLWPCWPINGIGIQGPLFRNNLWRWTAHCRALSFLDEFCPTTQTGCAGGIDWLRAEA